MLRDFCHTFASILLLSACTHGGGGSEVPLNLDASLTQVPPSDSKAILQKIAFGSCNEQSLPQPMWRKIAEEKPDLWIWTGDAIYSDEGRIASMLRYYDQQLKQPEYMSFLSSGIPVIGTYDDHDYGDNDAGEEAKNKAASMQLYLDFINEAKNSPRRKQTGIYTSYRFGPNGQRVKVLLTDTRYNRQRPGPHADLLGAEQWKWLEQEISKHDADLLLIVSGSQILPTEHVYEKWADYPASKKRLLNALDRSAYQNLILISGDRHFGELSKLDLSSKKVVWELTSSGLTHSFLEYKEGDSPNSLRVGEVLNRLNYGLLTIDWKAKPAQVKLEIRDINRQALISAKMTLK